MVKGDEKATEREIGNTGYALFGMKSIETNLCQYSPVREKTHLNLKPKSNPSSISKSKKKWLLAVQEQISSRNKAPHKSCFSWRRLKTGTLQQCSAVVVAVGCGGFGTGLEHTEQTQLQLPLFSSQPVRLLELKGLWRLPSVIKECKALLKQSLLQEKPWKIFWQARVELGLLVPCNRFLEHGELACISCE